MGMPKTLQDVLLRDALRSTGTSAKAWRDLIEAKLLDPAHRNETVKNYVISGEQYHRLKLISLARHEIDGRFTLGKLSFVLADRSQHWVPVVLLQNELRRKVSSYLGFVRRTLQRELGLSPQIAGVSEQQIYTAAKKLSRRLTKKVPQRKQIVAFSACYLFTTLILKMMYLRNPNPLNHAGTMKELLLHTGAVRHRDKGHIGFSFDQASQLANRFASTLSGLWLALSLDDSINILSASMHRVSDTDFRLALNADIRHDLKLPPIANDVREKVRPLILATLIAYRAKPPRDHELLDELFRCSDKTFRRLLSGFIVAIRVFLKLQPLLDAVRGKSGVK
jgi:hypothetical protein